MLKRLSFSRLIIGGITLFFVWRLLFVLYVLIILVLGIYDVINILILRAKSKN